MMLIWAVDSALGQFGYLRLVLPEGQDPVRYLCLCAGAYWVGDTQWVLACEQLQPVPVLPEPWGDYRYYSVR
jgi:hypothetical protein